MTTSARTSRKSDMFRRRRVRPLWSAATTGWAELLRRATVQPQSLPLEEKALLVHRNVLPPVEGLRTSSTCRRAERLRIPKQLSAISPRFPLHFCPASAIMILPNKSIVSHFMHEFLSVPVKTQARFHMLEMRYVTCLATGSWRFSAYSLRCAPFYFGAQNTIYIRKDDPT